MLNLQAMKVAVDQLLPDELRELRAYIHQREVQLASMLPVEERIRRMDDAARAIREGFSDEEWAQIERDMNDYSKSPDSGVNVTSG